jgi:CxxC-x17-CxxC domain-containing protein
MSYADKTLTCSDCNTSFTFSASEQEFFASKGFTNEPGRCPDCRAARKQQRGGSGGGYSGGSGGGYRQQREMFPAVCASCGKSTQVPFEPRNGRPVYCSDCYSKTKR